MNLSLQMWHRDCPGRWVATNKKREADDHPGIETRGLPSVNMTTRRPTASGVRVAAQRSILPGRAKFSRIGAMRHISEPDETR